MDGDKRWATGLLLSVPRLAIKLLLRHIDGDETLNLDAAGKSVPHGLEDCGSSVWAPSRKPAVPADRREETNIASMPREQDKKQGRRRGGGVGRGRRSDASAEPEMRARHERGRRRRRRAFICRRQIQPCLLSCAGMRLPSEQGLQHCLLGASG